MSAFVFTPQQVAEIRQQPDRIRCQLVLPSEGVVAERTRRIRRVIKLKDEGGAVVGTRIEQVQDVGYGGNLTPARVTILLVELVDVDAETATAPLRVLSFECARAAGYKTPGDMRLEYRGRHPRSEFAKLVWFALGDVRDRYRYLQRYVSHGGDYTYDRHVAIDDLPSLSEAQLAELAQTSHQKSEKKRADRSAALSELTLAQRVAQIEGIGGEMRREIKEELKIITDRTRRGQRKLAQQEPSV